MSKLLSEEKRRQIDQTIRDHHLAFLAEVFGKSAIPQADYIRLKREGKIQPGREIKVDAATRAHMLGVLSGEAQDKQIEEEIKPDDLIAVSEERQDELTGEERDAIQAGRERIGTRVRGLATKLEMTVGDALSEADDRLRRRRQIVRETVEAGVMERKEAAKVATDLRRALPGVAADFLRLAQTEIHNLTDEARAAAILNRAPEGSDPYVYKRPRPDACVRCNKLYLKPDGTPRIFRLSQLMANGTNYRLRAAEWKPVIGATHPWCACELHHVPAGFGFNRRGQLVKKANVDVEILDEELLRHDCSQ